MREIKFRLWDEPSDLYGCGGMTFYINELPKNDATATMQYTGLKDKNGVEIYEGDIIKWDPNEWGGEFSEVVKWDFEMLNIRQNDWYEWCEVIGNIYENPELREGYNE